MLKNVSPFLFLTLVLSIPSPLSAQAEREITNEQIIDHWKKSKLAINAALKKGIYFEASSAAKVNTKVHISENYLHMESEEWVFVYSKDQVFGLVKKPDGYSLINSYPIYQGSETREKTKFKHKVLMLQNSFLCELMLIRPFDFPKHFNYLPYIPIPNWAWLENSRFIKMDPIIKNQNGQYEIHYIEDTVEYLGGQGVYMNAILTIDPTQNFQVVSMKYAAQSPTPNGGLNPKATHGMSKYQFQKIPKIQNLWIMTDYQKQEQESGKLVLLEKVNFSNFRLQKINPNLLKLSHYGIPDETDFVQIENTGELSPLETGSAHFSPLVASITVIGFLFLLGQKARTRKLAQSC